MKDEIAEAMRVNEPSSMEWNVWGTAFGGKKSDELER